MVPNFCSSNIEAFDGMVKAIESKSSKRSAQRPSFSHSRASFEVCSRARAITASRMKSARTESGSQVPAAIAASGSSADSGWPIQRTRPSRTMKKRGVEFRLVPNWSSRVAASPTSTATDCGVSSATAGSASHARTFSTGSPVIEMNSNPSAW